MEETSQFQNSLYQTEPEISFFTGFNIDNDENDLNKIFPFELDEDKYYDVIFPSMHISNEELSSSNSPHISTENNENIMEKLTNFIDNYNIILNNESAVKCPNNFEENLKLAENTLPGCIIALMKAMQKPISEEVIYQNIKNKIHNFRKANGSKYSDDSRSVLNSTLKSSGIFLKTDEGLYYYKEKESMDFIIKNMERELKKKMSKEKKEIKSKSSQKSNTSILSSKSKNKTNGLSFSAQMNYRICKINTILDHMMTKCRGEPKYAKLNKMINGSSIEMLRELCEKDKFIGMLMCIKYFKNLSKFHNFYYNFLVEKYLKYVAKKKNIEHFFDLNKINEKILSVCEKIEQLEKNYNNINNFHEFNCNDYNCDYHSPMEICDTEITKKKTKQKKSITEKFNSSTNNSFYTNYSKE